MLRETLTPDAGVEGLDRCVVGWLPGAAEIELHAVRPRPVIEGARRELRPVVALDHRWESARGPEARQHARHVGAAELRASFECQALAGMGIDDGEHAELLAVGERITHEIHRPPLVRSRCRWPCL